VLAIYSHKARVSADRKAKVLKKRKAHYLHVIVGFSRKFFFLNLNENFIPTIFLHAHTAHHSCTATHHKADSGVKKLSIH